MAAFGNFGFVLQNLVRSADDCNGIESYCIYWVLSVIDYHTATGDSIALANFTPDADAKLEHAYDIFDNYTTALLFFGRVKQQPFLPAAQPTTLLTLEPGRPLHHAFATDGTTELAADSWSATRRRPRRSSTSASSCFERGPTGPRR